MPPLIEYGESLKWPGRRQTREADALSPLNTLRGMRIDVSTHRPILKMNTGGLSGPFAPLKMRDGLAEIAIRQGLSSVRKLTSGVQPW